jgi:hypothetical protein
MGEGAAVVRGQPMFIAVVRSLAIAEPKPEKKNTENSDGEDEDFDDDFDDDDDDDDESSDDDELAPAGKRGGGEVEAEDLEEGGGDVGDGGAGPSSGVKKRKAEDDDGFGKIEHGLSGDEVDAGNIIEGGRRARRGRGGEAKQQYTAKAEVASDEDSW